MQSRQELVCRRGFFQLLNEPAQAHLLRLCNGQEFNADSLRPAPAHGSILNLERSGLTKELRKSKHFEKACEVRRRAKLRKLSAIRKSKTEKKERSRRY